MTDHSPSQPSTLRLIKSTSINSQPTIDSEQRDISIGSLPSVMKVTTRSHTVVSTPISSSLPPSSHSSRSSTDDATHELQQLDSSSSPAPAASSSLSRAPNSSHVNQVDLTQQVVYRAPAESAEKLRIALEKRGMTMPATEEELLATVHLNGHYGRDTMFRSLWSRGIWWPNLRHDISRVLSSCDECIRHDVAHHGFHPMTYLVCSHRATCVYDMMSFIMV